MGHKIPTKYTKFVLLCCALFFISCTQQEQSEQEAGNGEMPGVNVIAVKAKKQDISDNIALVGSLEANEAIEIKSEMDGTIDQINFTEGQKVEKGDLLFQIDIKKLQASFNQAKADANLAQTTADRYEALVESRAVSRQEYDQTMAELESTEAKLVLVKEQLNDASIVAPFAGIMGERFVSIGQFIGKGAVLSSLVDQDPMKARFNVPERFLNAVSIGQDINMRVVAYTDETFKGEVYFIDPQIEESTRTALVKARVPNPDGRLRSGMFANLDLVMHVNDNAIVIPESALIVRADTLSIYVVKEDDTVELREVKTGKRFDGLVEVTDGCAAGDIVVVEGYQKIGPGSKVNVTIKDKAPKQAYEII